MASNKHYINNEPLTIHNIYKYLITLYKLNAVPLFGVEFTDNLNEIIFKFIYDDKWTKNGISEISYNIKTKIWANKNNILSMDDLYYKYDYLVSYNMIINNNNYMMLESYSIDDILEPSLCILENNMYDFRNLHTVNNTQIHNICYPAFHHFINNLIKVESDEDYSNFKNNNQCIPSHLWDNIYSKYKSRNTYLNLKNFIAYYVI